MTALLMRWQVIPANFVVFCNRSNLCHPSGSYATEGKIIIIIGLIYSLNFCLPPRELLPRFKKIIITTDQRISELEFLLLLSKKTRILTAGPTKGPGPVYIVEMWRGRRNRNGCRTNNLSSYCLLAIRRFELFTCFQFLREIWKFYIKFGDSILRKMITFLRPRVRF